MMRAVLQVVLFSANLCSPGTSSGLAPTFVLGPGMAAGINAVGVPMMMNATLAAVILLAVVSVRGEQAVGSAAPAFSLKDLKGADVTMAQQRGKVTIVNFWATWCRPCRTEMPILMKLQKVHGPAGLTVLGVSMDEQGAGVIANWLRKTRFMVDGKETAMNYPILVGTAQVSTAYGEFAALPATFIIDRQGTIVERIDGPVEFADVDKTVKPLLAGR